METPVTSFRVTSNMATSPGPLSRGSPVAVGRFRAGELHPERVFNL
jgi:hypothetical protein